MPLLVNTINIGGIVQPIWTNEDIESAAFKHSVDETINTIDNSKKKIIIDIELNNYLSSKIILPTPFDIAYGYVTYMVDSNLTSSYTSTVQMGVDGVIRVYRNVDDKGQPIKLGKLLRVLNPSILDHDIESIVSNHKKKYTIDTSKVKVSNNISNIYNVSSCGGSCMAHKGQYMDIYKDVGCSIAYLIEDKILKARAILWHDLKVTPYYANSEEYDVDNVYNCNMMDRVFFNNEKDKLTLEHWAKENGYVYYKDVVGRIATSRTIEETYDYVPYVDTLPFVTSDYKLSNVDDDYIDMLKEADGTSSSNNICSRSNQIYCEDTGNYVDEDSDYYYLEDDGVFWESNDDLIFVSDRGWYRADNANIVYCEDIQEYVNTRHDTVYEVEELDCYYYNDDDLVEIDDTYYHVDSDSICYAENVQEYRLLADCFLGEDEKYYA